MNWDMYFGYSWGMGFGFIFIIVFWILIILGLIAIVKYIKGKEPESALEILKKRYAKGEISKEEFEEKKKDLT